MRIRPPIITTPAVRSPALLPRSSRRMIIPRDVDSVELHETMLSRIRVILGRLSGRVRLEFEEYPVPRPAVVKIHLIVWSNPTPPHSHTQISTDVVPAAIMRGEDQHTVSSIQLNDKFGGPVTEASKLVIQAYKGE